MIKRNASMVGLWIALAGCGGAGESDEVVSANPPAPTATAPAPSPEQGSGSPAPAPEVPTSTPPEAAPPPALAKPPAPSVSGELVWKALQHGVSPDPRPSNPYTKDRPVYTEDVLYRFFVGGSLRSYRLVQVPSLANPLQGFAVVPTDVLDVQIVGSSGVVDWVVANGLKLTGPQLDLRKVNPVLDQSAATWRHGEWSVSLVVQHDRRSDLMRVCWDAYLPPPPPVASDDPNFEPFVRSFPLERLACGMYSISAPGPDAGGYVVDNYDGAVLTFRGEWDKGDRNNGTAAPDTALLRSEEAPENWIQRWPRKTGPPDE